VHRADEAMLLDVIRAGFYGDRTLAASVTHTVMV